MQFENTVWLFVGLAVCAGLGWAFHASQKGRIEALSKFASNHLLTKLTESVSPGRRRLKQVLLVLAVFSVFVALARPQVGFRWEEVKRKGIDIMLAVDTSKSMLAQDVAPNRLERSKFGIMDFVNKLGGDRVGLIPFAGDAFLMTPLTLDYGAFLESVRAVDTRTIPQGGTNIAAAIHEADRAFVDGAKQKILVLITDGEDLEGEALSAAKEAGANGVTIHTIGVGTPAGELIPAGKAGRKGSFVKDDKGQMVKSRLDESTLKEIATLTGGSYYPLGSRGEGLDRLYGDKLNLIPKQQLSERMKKVPLERFEWPLILALVFLLLEFAIGDRKSRRAMRAPEVETADRRIPQGAKTAAAAAVLSLMLFAPFVASLAHASPEEAQQAYETRDYQEAEAKYQLASEKDPANQELLFNLGAAAYQNKNYDKSADASENALKSTDLKLQNEAYYNLGNALYRKGQGTEKAKPEETIKHWEQALKSYDGAMKLKKDDADARFNYDYVKKKLEELKKKQQQKQQQNKDQKQNQNQQSKQNNKQDQDQQQSDKNQSNKSDKQDQDQDKQKKGQNEQSAKNEQDKKQKNQSGKDPKADSQAAGKDGKEKKEQPKKPGDTQKAKAKPEPKKDNESDARQAQGKPGQKTPGQQARASSGKQRRPGQMSKQEAERLLDSLKGDDQEVSFAPDKKGSGRANKNREYRDW